MSFSLVVDWDGTATERDTQWMILEEFGEQGVFEQVEQELLRGAMTHREVMEREWVTVRAPLAEVRGWLLERARLRPGFADVVERHDPLILSSGFQDLIEPVLARDGVAARVRANTVDPRPGGWRVVWTSDSHCAVCGEACKRGSLPPGPLVYVGDGYSDRCAAQAADRVLARDGLADFLERRGVAFERFDDFHDVAAALSDPV
jgi:2-hydroxy-3-keto-5-methylthiopentenyl-1-phosphate phosphatase